MITTLVLSPADLIAVLRSDPSVSDDNATKYGPLLLSTAIRYRVTTPLRLAYFLSQLAHESGGFKYTEELASGAAYERRKDLGNTQPGDGPRYKGRGLVQITGRASYARYAKFSGTDVVSEPHLLAEIPACVDSAGWFWQYGAFTDISKLADKDDIKGVTRLINGGYRGLADRKARLTFYKYEIDRKGALLVQKALNARLSYPRLVEDGAFGPQTTSVVREFQSDFFLTPNGNVDQSTWQHLTQAR